MLRPLFKVPLWSINCGKPVHLLRMYGRSLLPVVFASIRSIICYAISYWKSPSGKNAFLHKQPVNSEAGKVVDNFTTNRLLAHFSAAVWLVPSVCVQLAEAEIGLLTCHHSFPAIV